MPARLSVYFSDRPLLRRVVKDAEVCLIGRDEACDLAVEDPRVSRRHARLTPVAGGWRLEDLGSKNGTLVDGASPPRAALPAGSWLSLGGLPVRFERISRREQETAAERDRDRWQSSVLLLRRIDPAAGISAVLDRTLASVLELCGAERAGVVLVHPDGELELAATAGDEPLAHDASGSPAPSPPGPDDLAAAVFGGSRGAVERALSHGRPVVLADARADEVLAERASIVAGGIRALICLPLRVLGRSIGALYADSRRPGSAFAELDVEILEAVAEHAALAIGIARIHREVTGVRGEMPTPPSSSRSTAGLLSIAWERSLPAYRAPDAIGDGDDAEADSDATAAAGER